MIPHELRRVLPGDVFTARYMGWATLENGGLLDAAVGAEFDVVLTHGKGRQHQQNLGRYRVPVLQLDAPSNRIDGLLSLVPRFNEALNSIGPGDFVVVG